jgi:hypothetical protein
MSKFFSLAALVVGGIIIADILTHPTGTQAASSGINSLVGSSISGLLGVAPAASSTATAKAPTPAKKK